MGASGAASMTTILAMDCAAGACSAAVARDGRVLARRHEPMARGHAEALMPMVEEVLGRAGASYAELDLLAVTVGPGGFTGVRIGLAAARGIALAGAIPLLGVNTLETLAHGVPKPERGGRCVVAVLDSRRADLYVQSFAGDLAPLDQPAAVMPEDLEAMLPQGPLVFVGDGGARAIAAIAAIDDGRAMLSTAPAAPDAGTLAILAGARHAGFKARGEEWPAAEPLYLRPPDATIAAGGGRLRP